MQVGRAFLPAALLPEEPSRSDLNHVNESFRVASHATTSDGSRVVNAGVREFTPS